MNIVVNKAVTNKSEAGLMSGKDLNKRIIKEQQEPTSQSSKNKKDQKKVQGTQKTLKNKCQSAELSGKKQKKMSESKVNGRQNDKFPENKKIYPKKTSKDAKLSSMQRSLILSESDSQMSVQSNKREKRALIPANRQNPRKNLNLFTTNQQEVQPKNDKSSNVSIKNSLFKNKKVLNIQNEQRIPKAKVKSSQIPSKKDDQLLYNTVFLDNEKKTSQYHYQKDVHKKGENKMERLKNKLGFILDMANNDEVASVSYYSQTNSESSLPESNHVEQVQNTPKSPNMFKRHQADSLTARKHYQSPPVRKIEALKQAQRPIQTHKQAFQIITQENSNVQGHQKNKIAIGQQKSKDQNEIPQQLKKAIFIFKERQRKQVKQSSRSHNQILSSTQQQKKKIQKETLSPRFEIKLQKVQQKSAVNNSPQQYQVMPSIRTNNRIKLKFEEINKIKSNQQYTKREQIRNEVIKHTKVAQNIQFYRQQDYLQQELIQLIKKNDEILNIQKQSIKEEHDQGRSNQKSQQDIYIQKCAQSKRRLKTELNHRHDEQHILTQRERMQLKVLKRRQNRLIRKIYQQTSLDPRLFRAYYEPGDFKKSECFITQAQDEANKQIKTDQSTGYYEFGRMLPVVKTETFQSQDQKEHFKFQSPTERKNKEYYSNSSYGEYPKKLGNSQFSIIFKKKEGSTSRQEQPYNKSDRYYRTQNIRQKYQRIKRLVQKL